MNVEDTKEEKDAEKEKEEDAELEAVAGKSCTYTQTGNNYTEQHWYFCYTCRLVGSEGCCSVCARVCHRGHDVGYSRYSRFFCDCGASTTSACKSLKPIKYKPSQTPAHAAAHKKSSRRMPHVLRMVEDAEEDETAAEEGGLPVSSPLPQPTVASLLGVVSKESLVDTLFPVFAKLLQVLKVSPLSLILTVALF
jgi:E3 ubiquitin-protein ligase UBR4